MLEHSTQPGASYGNKGMGWGNAEGNNGEEQRSGKQRRGGTVEGHGIFCSKIRHRVNVICTSFSHPGRQWRGGTVSPSAVVYKNRLHKEERLLRSNPDEGGVFGLVEYFKGPFLLQDPSAQFCFYSSDADDLMKICSGYSPDGHTLQPVA